MITGEGLFGEPWDSLISLAAVAFFMVALFFIFKLPLGGSYR